MRIALGIEYDGSRFHGWQRLSHASTVQAEVEAALGFVAAAPIAVQCAGRTDAGVHAVCQVAHFDTDAQRPPRGWMMGANSRLPHAITVRWAVPVDAGFSARHSARARRYSYRILNRPVRPSLQRDYLTWERLPLDAQAMHRAAQALLGEHDFSAFRAAQCQATHARREMQRIAVHRLGEEVVVDVQANAFLHHMVRNIVGSLLPIGRGEKPETWMGELLHGRDRTRAGPTALAQGLTFIGPLYPEQWGLPAEVTL
ncbi:MAG: tRNA pseudouridine(38-40) synthase TruA [Proteobacteria bacterium]|nr:tRNA pseudouridine(38-40) synthase TruA [Pseudomonadota bacterium]